MHLQLLFLLPGNSAQQCIKPRGWLPPAPSPGSSAHIYAARLAFSSEAGSRAAVESPDGVPTAPRSSSKPAWLLSPSPSPISAKGKTVIAYLLGRAGASPCCEAPAAGLILPFVFFWGAPESPGACHGNGHAPHCYHPPTPCLRDSVSPASAHDAPVPEPLCESLGCCCLSPQLCGAGTSLPGGFCSNPAGAAAKWAPLPRVPPRQLMVPLLFVRSSSFPHPRALTFKTRRV